MEEQIGKKAEQANTTAQPSITGWPKEDDLALLEKIQKILPADDNLKFFERIKDINWHEMKFKSYSAEDCRNRVILVANQQRQFKSASELLNEAVILAKLKKNKSQKIELHPSSTAIQSHFTPNNRMPKALERIYYEEHKNELLKRNPHFNNQDLRMILMDTFNRLNVEEKAKYEEKVVKAKFEIEQKIQQLMKEIPNFPSRPEDPSMMYYHDHKDEFSKQNPQFSDDDVKMLLPERFKSLDAEKKSVYMQNFRKSNFIYYLKMQQLMKDYPDHAGLIRSEIRRNHKMDLPWSPTAKEIYYDEHRAEFLHVPPKYRKKNAYSDFSKLLYEQWMVYEEKASELREKEYLLLLEKFVKDHPEYENIYLQLKLKHIGESKSASAATTLQSDPTPEVIAPSVEEGVKRPATEDISGESDQKNKKMRSALEEMKNSSESQPIVEGESGTSKRKKKNKKSSVETVVATIEVERLVTQKESTEFKKKKKKIEVEVEQKATNKKSGELKKKKKKEKPSTVN